MKNIVAFFTRYVSLIVGKERMAKLLIYSSKTLNINLHEHGLIQMGAGISHIPEENGEVFFIENILPHLFKPGGRSVFFDVGAHIGNYAIRLRKRFQEADIYAFEPVEDTYDTMFSNASGFEINMYNVGLGEKRGTATIFNTTNNTNTELASLYRNIFDAYHESDEEISSFQFSIDTIDDFCAARQIQNINFLKIDVEGHELLVLKGASEMLSHSNIEVIQFEFNIHNVYSRVYLRDFYSLLSDFKIFRIVPNGLINLGDYNSSNEIFLLQNLLAVRKDICHLIGKSYLHSYY